MANVNPNFMQPNIFMYLALICVSSMLNGTHASALKQITVTSLLSRGSQVWICTIAPALSKHNHLPVRRVINVLCQGPRLPNQLEVLPKSHYSHYLRPNWKQSICCVLAYRRPFEGTSANLGSHSLAGCHMVILTSASSGFRMACLSSAPSRAESPLEDDRYCILLAADAGHC